MTGNADTATIAPVTPRPSASVMIVRDGPEGIEVFMLRRSPELDFSPNYLVFPGGAVDPTDQSPALLDDYDRGELLVYQLAAIREAFEESGFLFVETAAPGECDLEAVRQRLLAGEGEFYKEMTRGGLQLAPDLLHPVSHWITPEPARKRFSTYFFLARQPTGQRGSHDGTETVDSRWLSVKQVLAMCEGQQPGIMFPTEMNCRWLAGFADVAQALAAALPGRDIPSVTPRIEQRGGSHWLTLPADAGYGEVARKL